MLHIRWCHLALWSLATRKATNSIRGSMAQQEVSTLVGLDRAQDTPCMLTRIIPVACEAIVELRTGRCSAAAHGTKGVTYHFYPPGTSSNSSSNICMSYKMPLCYRMPLSVPSMPFFSLDLPSLNFKDFLWLWRQSKATKSIHHVGS